MKKHWGFVLLLTSLSACEQSIKQSNIYSTYTEASAAGALAYGLLPTFLPQSSQRIQEMHGHQTHDLLVTFAYAPDDKAAMLTKCKSIAATDLRYPRAFAEWWPEDLRTASYQAATYEYYHCTEDGGYLAINKAQSIAYFWRP